MQWAEVVSILAIIGVLMTAIGIGWRMGRLEKDWERDVQQLRDAITRLTERITESGIKE